ncbi:MAG TPA: sugar phosphate nucleotidyltransferase [Planctomycetota bacterium]|nr:sugar phosphate nucleotidyltransferase [Planctomycetota bacterium]
MRYHGLLLAAGKGTRLGNHAEDVPKALVRVGDETLVEHNLNRLLALGLEHVVVVIGHLADRVVDHLADHPHRDRIEFVEQTEPLGTGHAVSICRDALRAEPFVLCYCDNFTPYRLDPLIREHETRHHVVTLALYHCTDPTRHGIAQVEDGRIVDMVERPEHPVGDLAFAGMGVFESEIYDAVAAVRRSASGEYYLTDAVMDLIRAGRTVGCDVLDCMRVNVNSRAELEAARDYFRTRQQRNR